MNLIDAKTLLEKRRIPYHTAQYESEAEYWQHISRFPDLRQAGSCRVTALIVPSVNGVKDIELQFNRQRGEYILADMWFGGYCFDMSDSDPDLLEADILDLIGQIVENKMAIILVHDLKRRCCLRMSSYDLTEDDNVFGAPGFREAVAKIEAPKTFRQKLTCQKLQYDIYDWRTCRQIVK